MYISSTIHQIQTPQFIVDEDKIVFFKKNATLHPGFVLLVHTFYEEFDGSMGAAKGVYMGVLVFNRKKCLLSKCSMTKSDGRAGTF